jgi:hypothetical protein
VTCWSFFVAASMGAWACVGDEPSVVVPSSGDAGGADASTAESSAPSVNEDSGAPAPACKAGTRPGFGLFDTGSFELWLSIEHATDAADFEFSPAGAASNLAVAGHWAVGDDTVGWFTPATPPSYTLLSANTTESAPHGFYFGPTSDALLPVVGDWDGNGTTTIGVFDQPTNRFFLQNANQKQDAADFTFSYGPALTNGRPVAGDWDGDGKDGVGIFVPTDGRFLLRNTPTSGAADVIIGTSHTGDDLWPLASQWNGCAVTVALYSRTTGVVTYLETNATGATEHTFMTTAGASKIPLVGHWKK